ncbi:MAG: hypothetical protein HZB19_08970 [Chloroflexi bacterium]|nr:hypothetical protein [Chloroflexota bacterium]
MSKNVGLWIDHKKAVMVILDEQGEELKLIQANTEKRVRVRGGARMKSVSGAQYFPAEDHKDRQYMERLHKFYGTVIAHIRDADSVLLFGPGEAKSELENRIAHEKASVQIAGIENADKMTERQIAAKVRSYFHKRKTI